MKITLATDENNDADIFAHCDRHGLVTIEKISDPLRPTFAGKEWADAQIQGFAESVLRGQSVRCPICRTVIRSKKDAGFVILNCLLRRARDRSNQVIRPFCMEFSRDGHEARRR